MPGAARCKTDKKCGGRNGEFSIMVSNKMHFLWEYKVGIVPAALFDTKNGYFWHGHRKTKQLARTVKFNLNCRAPLALIN